MPESAAHMGVPGKITVLPFFEGTINSHLPSSGKGLAIRDIELLLYSLSLILDRDPELT